MTDDFKGRLADALIHGACHYDEVRTLLMQTLLAQMRCDIKKEAFEDAARVRDLVNELRNGVSPHVKKPPPQD